MAKPLHAFRVYASTLSSFLSLPNDLGLSEVHIVLPFARDYDKQGNFQVGKFFVYFDTSTFNPEAIIDFKNMAKNNNLTVKFFLSIGGRDPRFPFAVTSGEEAAWIQNATDSLRELVNQYHIDGIDVYYEHIKPESVAQFGKAIPKVIENLKNDNSITAASITVSSPLLTNYFNPYKANEKLFEYVVYQTHTYTELPPIRSSGDLILVIENLPYPNEKIFAGYSEDPRDWSKVPPLVFLFAVPGLLGMGLCGISIWILSPNGYNPEA